MNDKKVIVKICIKCVDANKALGNVNSNFKIQCEYGACDVCGEHYVIVPYARYFQPNAKVEAYIGKGNELEKKVEELNSKVDAMVKHLSKKQEKVKVSESDGKESK